MLSKLKQITDSRNPLRFVASRILWASKLSSLLTIKRQDYRLRFYPTSFSATLWSDPGYADQDEQFLRRYLRPGDRVIDAGANIGVLTLTAAAAVGSLGKVYSIEAHPRTYRYLAGNLQLNGSKNVKAFNVALGAAEGTLTLTNKRADDMNCVDAARDGLSVPVSRLDSIIPESDPIDLLKIDVEGYERFVLSGAARVLEQTECVFFESWNEQFRKYGYGCRDLFALLNDAGFSVYRLIDGCQARAIGPGYQSIVCENLVAVKDLNRFLLRTGCTLAPGLPGGERKQATPGGENGSRAGLERARP